MRNHDSSFVDRLVIPIVVATIAGIIVWMLTTLVLPGIWGNLVSNPQSNTTCLSVSDLAAQGRVLQHLESPPGVLAGAQIAFAANWEAPKGWIIHKNSQNVTRVLAGDIASVWSDERCRPLKP